MCSGDRKRVSRPVFMKRGGGFSSSVRGAAPSRRVKGASPNVAEPSAEPGNRTGEAVPDAAASHTAGYPAAAVQAPAPASPFRGVPVPVIRGMARRPLLPAFWRNIAPRLLAVPPEREEDAGTPGLAARLFPPSAPDERFFYWRLVLSAKGIPFRFIPARQVRRDTARPASETRRAFETREGGAGNISSPRSGKPGGLFRERTRPTAGPGALPGIAPGTAPWPGNAALAPPGAAGLYVPPLCEGTAIGEILAFEREKPAPSLPSPPDKGGLWVLALFFFALFAWHYLRWNAPGAIAALPASPEDWVRFAGLDAYRTKVMGEWYRTVTALTLHADAPHIAGNIVLGAVFMVPLCRRIGPGMTLLLTLLAGAAANAVMVFFRPASSMTIGFSTALFSAVGLLSAIMAVHAFTHSMESVRALFPPRGKISGHVLKNAVLQGMLPFGAGLGVLAMLGGSDVPGVSYLSHCMGLLSGLVFGTLFARYGQRVMRLEGGTDAVLQSAALLACAALLVSAWLPVLFR